jgi:hypothetical protein
MLRFPARELIIRALAFPASARKSGIVPAMIVQAVP